MIRISGRHVARRSQVLSAICFQAKLAFPLGMQISMKSLLALPLGEVCVAHYAASGRPTEPL